MSWIIKASPQVIRTEEDEPEALKVGDRVRIKEDQLVEVDRVMGERDMRGTRREWEGTINRIYNLSGTGRDVQVYWDEAFARPKQGDYMPEWLELIR